MFFGQALRFSNTQLLSCPRDAKRCQEHRNEAVQDGPRWSKDVQGQVSPRLQLLPGAVLTTWSCLTNTLWRTAWEINTLWTFLNMKFIKRPYCITMCYCWCQHVFTKTLRIKHCHCCLVHTVEGSSYISISWSECVVSGDLSHWHLCWSAMRLVPWHASQLGRSCA